MFGCWNETQDKSNVSRNDLSIDKVKIVLTINKVKMSKTNCQQNEIRDNSLEFSGYTAIQSLN